MTDTARENRAFPTPIEVLGVTGDTAQVVIVGWHITEPVTVPAGLLAAATGLTPDELPGRWLEATVNCHAARVEDLTITDITLAPNLPDGWMDGDGAVTAEDEFFRLLGQLHQLGHPDDDAGGIPALLSPGRWITGPDEAEALGLTVEARRLRAAAAAPVDDTDDDPSDGEQR